MSDYRVYTIGDDGNFINSRAFSCDNDPDAIEWAKQLVDGHDIELRSGARLIIRLKHKLFVQRVETIAGFCLRFRVQRLLQFLNSFRS